MAAPHRGSWLLGAALALLVTAWCVRPLWDIDLWWHIATGRLILDGAFPTQDVFSAADPSAPWRTFQWGYEVLVAGLERSSGLRAVQLLHAGAVGLAAGLAGLFAHRAAGGGRAALGPALAAVMVGLLLFEDRVRARPHVFELLFVVSLLPLVTERARGAGVELAVVLLAGIWANLHAVSALWWGALVGAWTLGRPSARRFGVLGAGVVVMLASPPAREGLLGALSSHSDWPAELVPELRGTLAYLEEGWWGAATLAGVASGVVSALWLARRGGAWAPRLVALGCAAAACLMGRWVWFAAVPVGLLLVALPLSYRRWSWALVGLAAAALLGRVGPRWQHTEDWTRVVQAGAFPEEAMDIMEAQGFAPPLDTKPSWTGYALYRLHPPLRTLSDGRLIFGPEVVDLQLRRSGGDASTFDEAAARFGTRALLWSTDAPPPLDPARWRLVHQDPVASLWVPAPPP